MSFGEYAIAEMERTERATYLERALGALNRIAKALEANVEHDADAGIIVALLDAMKDRTEKQISTPRYDIEGSVTRVERGAVWISSSQLGNSLIIRIRDVRGISDIPRPQEDM